MGYAKYLLLACSYYWVSRKWFSMFVLKRSVFNCSVPMYLDICLEQILKANSCFLFILFYYASNSIRLQVFCCVRIHAFFNEMKLMVLRWKYAGYCFLDLLEGLRCSRKGSNPSWRAPTSSFFLYSILPFWIRIRIHGPMAAHVRLVHMIQRLRSSNFRTLEHFSIYLISPHIPGCTLIVNTYTHLISFF